MEREVSVAEDIFAGGGEMGGLVRSRDWSQTPLGAVENWPSSLKTAVRQILTSPYPMFLWWGEHLTNFYNDAAITALGKRHPEALGRSASEVWAKFGHDRPANSSSFAGRSIDLESRITVNCGTQRVSRRNLFYLFLQSGKQRWQQSCRRFLHLHRGHPEGFGRSPFRSPARISCSNNCYQTPAAACEINGAGSSVARLSSAERQKAGCDNFWELESILPIASASNSNCDKPIKP
ncbi:MAG: hypothetical protein HC894_09345 [Microcoleus sp. SM1_3_4]|nr:hypothetical protein [Microcoleus sp. SM1_3_4]